MSGSVSKKLKSKSRWKKFQKQNKTRHKVGLGVTALICLIILIIIGKAISFVFSLNQPYSLDGSPTLSSTDPGYSIKNNWSGQGVFNILFKSGELSLISIDNTSKTITILDIPEDTNVELPLGFGKWPIRSVYGLGQAEKPPVGARLLEETVSSVFGVPVDGYLIYSSDSKLSAESLISDIHQNPLLFDKLLKGKTDMSLVELVRLWGEIRVVRSDKVKVLDLGKTQLTNWTLLKDGSRVLNIDKPKLDQFVQNNFTDQKVADEGLSIGVYNATSYPGLAEKAARTITNMGGRVVTVSNSSEKTTKTTVTGNKSYTQKRLSAFFASCSKSQSDCKLPAEVDLGRVDISIIIGEDYFLKYNR